MCLSLIDTTSVQNYDLESDLERFIGLNLPTWAG